MSAPTTGRVPAGWYPDPSTPSQVRWWDSAAWTSDVQSVPQQRSPAPASGGWTPTPSPVPASAPRAYQTAPGYQTVPTSGWQQTNSYRPGNIDPDLSSGKNAPARNGFAFAVLSLFGVPIACILGMVLSIMGLSRSKRYARAGCDTIGRRKAIWGIVLSSLGTVITVVLLSAVLSDRLSWSDGVVSWSDGVKAGSDATRGDVMGNVDYLGTDLAADVTRVLTVAGTAVADATCADTATLAAGVITDCTATVGGTPTGIRVTFGDALGHFTLLEQAL